MDDDRAVADEDDDDLARLVVDLAVDEPGGHVEEAAPGDIDVLAAAGAEVETDPSADDVAECLPITVVMPAWRC